MLTLVDNAVYANCDAADGVPDALIQNPGVCSFNPQSLLCSGGNTADCLTQSQVDTLSAWFAAATDAQGRVVSLGFPVSDLYNNGAAGNNLFRWTKAARPPHDINAAAPWGEATSAQPAGWAFYERLDDIDWPTGRLRISHTLTDDVMRTCFAQLCRQLELLGTTAARFQLYATQGEDL